MFYLTLILPLVAAAYMFIFHRSKVCTWEYCLLFGVSIVSYAITTMIMYKSNTSDTEYFGSLGVKVRHYDHWNEYIHKTCSYTTCTGSGKTRSCTTHYYDCSYVKDHPEYWVLISATGKEYEITQSYFDELRTKWKAKEIFVEMSRHYHTIDGDAQEFDWDNRTQTAQGISSEHTYVNKTQSANTIFKFRDMNEKEAREKGLYEYPDIYSGFIQPTILGATVSDTTTRKYEYLNGVLGSQKQVRVFILYFWNQGKQAAFDQRNYWKGGNKNELVICIGVDKKTRRVTWVESFSWCKIPAVESRINGWYAQHQEFNIDKLQPELMKYIYSDWHRRDFKDFDYIEIELSYGQVVFVWVLLSIICVGVSAWIVMNEFDRK